MARSKTTGDYQITAKIPQELVDRLDALAVEHRITRAAVVRHLIYLGLDGGGGEVPVVTNEVISRLSRVVHRTVTRVLYRLFEDLPTMIQHELDEVDAAHIAPRSGGEA